MNLLEWDEPIEIERHDRAFSYKNRKGVVLLVFVPIAIPLVVVLLPNGWVALVLSMGLILSIPVWYLWILPRRWNKEPAPKHIAITDDGVSITNDRLNLDYRWPYLYSFAFIEHPDVPPWKALRLRMFPRKTSSLRVVGFRRRKTT